MKCVILCGGEGTRLREETEFKPKPMVHIGSKPIIWHIMKIYARFGITEFILPLGYRGEFIREYFHNYEIMNSDVTLELGQHNSCVMHQNHSEIGWKITLVDTGDHTLKGGRIKRIQKYVEDDVFMLTYGDGVADIDLDALLAFHKKHGRMATVTGVNPLARFGELMVRGDAVTSFHEKLNSSDGALISGGFFVFNAEIFDHLTESEECDLEYGALEKIAEQGELMVYKHKGFWYCMDTLRDVEALNKMWRSGVAKWKVW